ncbi:omega-amidase NIT2 [Cimex lectularius]|uniref:omega-amidase n=1 Tax=Cimex lectularius TaxID=79782 RepID=A0A8I6RVV5_CIMLE|nr:omega-amidase NIT2 [Cimex lectularius]
MSSVQSMFKLALVQMKVGKDKVQNIKKALTMISQAKCDGSTLVVLPECFNSPYGTRYFNEYAEEVPEGETCKALSEAAKENCVFLIGGSIPEREGQKLYNTSTVWSPEGQLLCKYRKTHLFDIDIPGKMTFKESDVLTKGEKTVTFKMGNCKIGLGICYDIRFNELANVYRKEGIDMLVYPGCFNRTTGPLHWELLARSRAVDNQVFVAAASAAPDETADYVAWGHSMVVSPWGKVLVDAEFEEKTVVTEIDLKECEQMRAQIPVLKQRRTDLYDTLTKSNL